MNPENIDYRHLRDQPPTDPTSAAEIEERTLQHAQNQVTGGKHSLPVKFV